MMDFSDKIRGCYWGLCLGDALGMPVEFKSLNVIKEKYGISGVERPPKDAIFTDDTEMSIAVTKALMAMGTIEEIKTLDDDDIAKTFAREFLQWLKNPGFAPGITCMNSVVNLKKYGEYSWRKAARNDSKGCGTVMRAAPLGIWYAEKIGEELKNGKKIYHEELKRVSKIQSEITHNHKAATAAALAGSYAVALAFNDVKPLDMLPLILHYCSDIHPDFDSELEKLESIIEKGGMIEDYRAIKALGGGWVGEEAFGIAMYSVIRYPDDFVKCLQVAVNHDGDSDSTGCIAGAIIGALNGYTQIPQDWIKSLHEGQRYRHYVENVLEYFKG
ncbi:MAG: ADP-ribosylglycohydrolase family protein [Candidatus Hodarchaeales archaeon]